MADKRFDEIVAGIAANSLMRRGRLTPNDLLALIARQAQVRKIRSPRRFAGQRAEAVRQLLIDSGAKADGKDLTL